MIYQKEYSKTNRWLLNIVGLKHSVDLIQIIIYINVIQIAENDYIVKLGVILCMRLKNNVWEKN